MLYTCNTCRFTFKRSGKAEACPDCGKLDVREATMKEKTEYEKNRKRYDSEEETKTK